MLMNGRLKGTGAVIALLCAAATAGPYGAPRPATANETEGSLSGRWVRPGFETNPAADRPVSVVPPLDREHDVVLEIRSAERLSQLFEAIEYDWRQLAAAGADLPRVLVRTTPDDMTAIAAGDERKQVFTSVLLPIVLRVNEDILVDREHLVRLKLLHDFGFELPDAERDWIARLGEAYGVATDEPGIGLEELARRVDAIPPSMALAQAAVESGWGTSRLARRGNALFGQTARSGGHAEFDRLIDGAAAYARNLNTHAAYAEFRAMRADMRSRGLRLDGDQLVGTLLAYSERGGAYVRAVRSLLRHNDLALADEVRLDPRGGDFQD